MGRPPLLLRPTTVRTRGHPAESFPSGCRCIQPAGRQLPKLSSDVTEVTRGRSLRVAGQVERLEPLGSARMSISTIRPPRAMRGAPPVRRALLGPVGGVAVGPPGGARRPAAPRRRRREDERGRAGGGTNQQRRRPWSGERGRAWRRGGDPGAGLSPGGREARARARREGGGRARLQPTRRTTPTVVCFSGLRLLSRRGTAGSARRRPACARSAWSPSRRVAGR